MQTCHLPCRPAILDLRAILSTKDIADLAKSPALAVINAAPPRGHLADQAADAIRGSGLEVASVGISQRAAFAERYGTPERYASGTGRSGTGAVPERYGRSGTAERYGSGTGYERYAAAVRSGTGYAAVQQRYGTPSSGTGQRYGQRYGRPDSGTGHPYFSGAKSERSGKWVSFFLLCFFALFFAVLFFAVGAFFLLFCLLPVRLPHRLDAVEILANLSINSAAIGDSPSNEHTIRDMIIKFTIRRLICPAHGDSGNKRSLQACLIPLLACCLTLPQVNPCFGQERSSSWTATNSFTLRGGAAPVLVRSTQTDSQEIILDYSLPSPTISPTGNTYRAKKVDRIDLSSAPKTARSGHPRMPVIPVRAAIPAGRTVDLAKISVLSSGHHSFNGSHFVEFSEGFLPSEPTPVAYTRRTGPVYIHGIPALSSVTD